MLKVSFTAEMNIVLPLAIPKREFCYLYRVSPSRNNVGLQTVSTVLLQLNIMHFQLLCIYSYNCQHFICCLFFNFTGIVEVTSSNSVEALIFFKLLLSNCLNWKIYCDDHSLLSSTTAEQI